MQAGPREGEVLRWASGGSGLKLAAVRLDWAIKVKWALVPPKIKIKIQHNKKQ